MANLKIVRASFVLLFTFLVFPNDVLTHNLPNVVYHRNRIGFLPPPEENDIEYHDHAVGYQFSTLKDIERKKYEDGSNKMIHRKMMRPHEEMNDARSLHAFPIKIYTTTNGV